MCSAYAPYASLGLTVGLLEVARMGLDQLDKKYWIKHTVGRRSVSLQHDFHAQPSFPERYCSNAATLASGLHTVVFSVKCVDGFLDRVLAVHLGNILTVMPGLVEHLQLLGGL